MDESMHRKEDPDEVVEHREVVQGPPGISEPTRVQRVTSKTMTPLATWTRGIRIALAVIEVLLAIRFILKLMAANPEAGFGQLMYGVLTAPLMAPFIGLLPTPTSAGGNMFETQTLLAMAVYALLAWLVLKVARLTYSRTHTQTVEDITRR